MPEETSKEWETHEKISGDPLREWYAKEIWGQRATSDDTLFEVMSLQVQALGLQVFPQKAQPKSRGPKTQTC